MLIAILLCELWVDVLHAEHQPGVLRGFATLVAIIGHDVTMNRTLRNVRTMIQDLFFTSLALQLTIYASSVIVSLVWSFFVIAMLSFLQHSVGLKLSMSIVPMVLQTRMFGSVSAAQVSAFRPAPAISTVLQLRTRDSRSDDGPRSLSVCACVDGRVSRGVQTMLGTLLDSCVCGMIGALIASIRSTPSVWLHKALKSLSGVSSCIASQVQTLIKVFTYVVNRRFVVLVRVSEEDSPRDCNL